MPVTSNPAHPSPSARSFPMLLVATVAAFAGYVLLLPVVPLWAVRSGVSEAAAGTTTGMFMLVTVLTQLGMPWLLGRVDHRVALASGTLLIGLPAPLFAVATDLWSLLVVSALRGVGFGLLTVTGSALVAELVAPARRGRAAGLYGMAVGVPHAVLLPTGVWLADHVGFVEVFWFAAGCPVAGAIAAVGMGRVPARDTNAAGGRTFPVTLLPPWLVMTAVSLAAGGLVAYLPLAVGGSVGPAALLAFGAASVGFRWVAGQVGDRIGSRSIMVPSALLACAGLVVVAVGTAAASWLAIAGALALGAGFGALQNAALVLMFERAGSGPASTAWNVAYDAGNGLGSVGFGVLVGLLNYPATFAVAALLVAVSVPIALLLVRGRGSVDDSSAA